MINSVTQHKTNIFFKQLDLTTLGGRNFANMNFTNLSVN